MAAYRPSRGNRAAISIANCGPGFDYTPLVEGSTRRGLSEKDVNERVQQKLIEREELRAAGVIIGSSLKKDGVWWNGVDHERVRAFSDRVAGKPGETGGL